MPFKVILIGGGPTGLTAAHALTHANIDFVMLESRKDIIIDAGSNLVLAHNGMRILGQLGLFDEINKVSSALPTIHRINHDGEKMPEFVLFKYLAENFGIEPRVLSRHDLTKTLYDALPQSAREKLHASKKVSDIIRTADGVTVSCTDGTEYEGSVVIGADGVHSIVRRRMDALQRAAAEAEEKKKNVISNDEKPFLSSYRCLWIRFPTPEDMGPGYASETHGPQISTQLFTGPGSGVTGVYERLSEPKHDSARYGPADEEALIERWGHLPLTPGGKLTLGEVYKGKMQSGLVDLEEGVVPRWSWDGRIVLVGDAAHKFTPSTGMGCNNGMEDIVALVNELHRITVVQGTSSTAATDDGPARADIAAALEAYQAKRQDLVEAACKQSGGATAMASWHTGVHKFLDQWVISSVWVQWGLAKLGAPKSAKMPVFEFITGEESFSGKQPWVNGIPKELPRAVVA